MGETYEAIYIGQMKFGKVKVMDIPISFIWIFIFFDEVSKYGNSTKCWGYARTNAENSV
jgi:hypothetical protein